MKFCFILISVKAKRYFKPLQPFKLIQPRETTHTHHESDLDDYASCYYNNNLDANETASNLGKQVHAQDNKDTEDIFRAGNNKLLKETDKPGVNQSAEHSHRKPKVNTISTRLQDDTRLRNVEMSLYTRCRNGDDSFINRKGLLELDPCNGDCGNRKDGREIVTELQASSKVNFNAGC